MEGGRTRHVEKDRGPVHLLLPHDADQRIAQHGGLPRDLQPQSAPEPTHRPPDPTHPIVLLHHQHLVLKQRHPRPLRLRAHELPHDQIRQREPHLLAQPRVPQIDDRQLAREHRRDVRRLPGARDEGLDDADALVELGGLVERDVLREARDLALEGRELECAAAGDDGVDRSLSTLVSS